MESIRHIFFQCPINKYLWLQSLWNINIDAFGSFTMERWICFLLGDSNQLPLDDSELHKMTHFAVVLMERTWLERNRILKGHPPLDWMDIARSLNCQFLKYWAGSERRRAASQARAQNLPLLAWKPPPHRTLKMNFDAAFKDGKTTTVVILRNHIGQILRAWVNRFDSENALCAETEAATQALQNAIDVQLDCVQFEGDAFNVIMALNGLDL